MKSFVNLIIYDYLQRTRSYPFLITLCLSLAVAYTFVPEPHANYSTIRIGDYLGYYNSAWFGYVTAIMTSIFLSLIGFYLVNSGIKTDVHTRVGQIMASTPVKNQSYLLAKTLSNFAVLCTIVLLVFLMAIALFYFYHDPGFPFEVAHFLKPYLLITLPALFFISCLAVCFEVLLGRYTTLQNGVFFFLFCALAIHSPSGDSRYTWDALGSKIVTDRMETQVQELTGTPTTDGLTIGYVLGHTAAAQKFAFKGIAFPITFLWSRLGWMFAGLVLVLGCAPFFSRFDFQKPMALRKPKKLLISDTGTRSISVSQLTPPQPDFGVWALFKTEFLLWIRHGKKWMWVLHLVGMVLLAILPLNITHRMVLPVLWFLQVGRLSGLTSKELTYGIHYFSFSSYRPIRRLLSAQVGAAWIYMLALSAPLLLRYGVLAQGVPIVSVVFGSMLMVCLAAFLGLLTRGKKLFEVLFFMICYGNINAIPFLDYFGGLHTTSSYVLQLFGFVVLLASATIGLRMLQLRQ